MEESGYKKYFGISLAELLAEKLQSVYLKFSSEKFISEVKRSNIRELELVDRTVLLAKLLHAHLPSEYPKAIAILQKIYGPPNPKETGMFTTGYWLWPVAKFIELYGIEHFTESMEAVKEITKRHTGEYAIRPFINKYPEKALKEITKWSVDENVHVRRLASEGLRPRLPWSQKLTLFIDNPKPVFHVLENLKDDPSNFVQKSVANNVNDYVKDNREAAYQLLNKWKHNITPQRNWVIKHALRNEMKKKNKEARKLLREI